MVHLAYSYLFSNSAFFFGSDLFFNFIFLVKNFISILKSPTFIGRPNFLNNNNNNKPQFAVRFWLCQFLSKTKIKPQLFWTKDIWCGLRPNLLLNFKSNYGGTCFILKLNSLSDQKKKKKLNSLILTKRKTA